MAVAIAVAVAAAAVSVFSLWGGVGVGGVCHGGGTRMEVRGQ